MTRKITLTSLGLFGALGITGYASTAHAVDEYSLILLDRTGSMSANTNPSNSAQTRWTDAMDAIKGVISSKDLVDPSVKRAYAIWDFRLGLGTDDPTQDNARQVWPLEAKDCTDLCGVGSGCAEFITKTSLAGTTNYYCDFTPAPDTSPYTKLIQKFESFKTDPTRTPDPNFMGRTPLADALCRVLNTIRLADQVTPQTITLEADGLENNSSRGDCGNWEIASTAEPFSTDPNTSWNKGQNDWGMSAAVGSGAPDAIGNSTYVPGGGSWQARVVRRSLRLNDANSANATSSYIVPNEMATTNLAWRVNVHYTTFDSSMSTMSAAAVSSPALTAASTVSATDNRDTGRGVYNVSASLAGITPTMLAWASPTAAVTTTAGTTLTTDIPAAELSMFRQLASPSFPSQGNGASRSLFQAFTLLPGQTYGTNHVLEGDVDDSGCVDRADYSIMTQRDVWYQRALPPLQIAMRADLNKDGWVNDADRAILIANWGHGCINPVGAPPTF